MGSHSLFHISVTTIVEDIDMSLGKAILKICLAILLAFAILSIAGSLAAMLGAVRIVASEALSGAFITHLVMLLLAVLVMLIFSKGKLAAFGFRIGLVTKLPGLIALCLGAAILSTFIGTILPGDELTLFEAASFLQVVIFVWIWASICEEVLFRGLMLGYLQPLTIYGINFFRMRISLPVLVSALLFGLIHFNPMILGMGTLRAVNIVVFAFILGIIAGYQREKTGSLIPAIMAHALFNVGGTLMGYLLEAI